MGKGQSLRKYFLPKEQRVLSFTFPSSDLVFSDKAAAAVSTVNETHIKLLPWFPIHLEHLA